MRQNPSYSTSSSTTPCRADSSIQITSTWQDDADEEEWSAWMDNNDPGFATETRDEDQFGAWVDSADFQDPIDFRSTMSTATRSTATRSTATRSTATRSTATRSTATRSTATRSTATMSTAVIPLERSQGPLIATMRRQQSMDDGHYSVLVPGPAPKASSTLPSNDMSSLYINPWDDHILPSESSTDYTEEDAYEIDPEIDSALAYSAWESTLSRNCAGTNDSDDESAVFGAWDDSEETDYHNFAPANQAPSNSTIIVNGVLPVRSVYDEYQSKHGKVNSTALGEAKADKDTDREGSTWMQLLIGKPG